MATRPVHPAVAPVVASLTALIDYRPTSDADLAEVLRSVHDVADPCVIEALADVLCALAYRTKHHQVTSHLNEAAELLYALGADEIDRARADTGHYNGTARTASHL